MATAFRPKSGRISGRLDAEEIAILVHVLGSTRDFVAPDRQDTGDPLVDLVAGLDSSEPAPEEPQDPALLRLLPVAHRTDAAQAEEFRALTEHSLRRRKAANLDAAIEVLTAAGPGKIELDQQQAGGLMVALTDVRLVLGERLGLRTDEDSAAVHEQLRAATSGPDDAAGSGDDDDTIPSAVQVRFQQMAYYDFLSWLQESLAVSLLES
ncbi:MAG: DUF2017 family protein [Ornithinimicrobium sp.]